MLPVTHQAASFLPWLLQGDQSPLNDLDEAEAEEEGPELSEEALENLEKAPPPPDPIPDPGPL